MENTIKIKIEATPEQVAEMKRIKKLRHPPSRKPKPPFSPLGEYLVNNYGKEISEALFNEHKDDTI